MFVPKAVQAALLVTTVLCLIELCEPVELGQRGVCLVEVSNPDGSKTNETECCNGWKYISATDTCKPTCVAGCPNGTCVDVNKCICTPPRVLENYVCVIPDCDKPCVNGICTSRNSCTCKKGYKKADNYTCVPECSLPCENGDCVAPEECRCHNGYNNENGICKPVCKRGCLNGICIGPDKCECNNGYELEPHSDTVCIATCDKPCVNGTCTSPNSCTCNKGYKKADSYTCVPECSSPCKNGYCVAPEECRCHDQYKKADGICKPVCDNECINSICTEPNKCECIEGYKLGVGNQFNCTPFCENKCVNAKCVSPNQCKCETGYKETAKWWECEPQCNSCHFGACIAPNNCSCSNGYERNSFGCVSMKAVDCNINSTCPSQCDYDGEQYCCENGIPIAPCFNPLDETPAEITGLAGLELSWTLGGVVGLLMLMVVGIVMQRIWHNSKQYNEAKQIDNDMANGSVVYTLPHTLLQSRMPEDYEHDEEAAMHDRNTDTLLPRTDPDVESIENIRL